MHVLQRSIDPADGTGKPFQYVAIKTDITELKEVELEFETNQQLFKNQNLQLEQACCWTDTGTAGIERGCGRGKYDKDHFFSNMSNKLRTPLKAIMGFSEIKSDQFLGPWGLINIKIISTISLIFRVFKRVI